jgi:hypothetical protein
MTPARFLEYVNCATNAGERLSDHPVSPLLGCHGDRTRDAVQSVVALETSWWGAGFPFISCRPFTAPSLLLFLPLKETLTNLSLFVKKNKDDILSGLQC